MSGYLLHCSVCDSNVETRSVWLQHLLQPEHLNLARKEVIRWSEEVKKCALVIFASFPVVTIEVLEYFSKGKDIVTDFVSLPDNPQAGVLQFESREKVKEILAKVKTAEIRINNQLVELRKVSNYLTLEWNQLILQCSMSSTPLEERVEERINSSNTIINSQNFYQKGVKSTAKIPPFESVFLKQSDKVLQVHTPILTGMFNDLRAKVKYLAKDYTEISGIVYKLRKIFPVIFPQSQIYIFRHVYLRLIFNGDEDVPIFIDHVGELAGHKVNLEVKLDLTKVKEILRSPAVQEIFLSSEVPISLTKRSFGEQLEVVFEFRGLRFAISCHPFLKEEIQTCRLLQYLCTFDSRIIPLLTMVHFWRKVNHISFKNPDWKDNPLRYIPDPAAMHWLVMLVLCRNKVIPTPAEIVNQPGKPYKIFKCGTDIGFHEDENFVKSWKASVPQPPSQSSNNFVWSVLELAEVFFSCVGDLQYDSWILNTRDGEIFKKSDVPNDTKELAALTKLTEQEMEMVKQRDYKKDGCINKQYFEKTVLLHPLRIQPKFTFCPDVFVKNICPSMKLTAGKINRLLTAWKSNSCRGKVNLESLFKDNTPVRHK